MQRRHFLGQLTAVACLGTSRYGFAVDPASAPRIVDTHTHFYDPTRPQGVPWPPRESPLYRPVYPRDWTAVAAPLGVRETVVVEASAWLEDNQWILDLADRTPAILGLVGHLTPGDGDFAKHLKRLAAHRVFRGIRVGGNLPQNVEDPAFRAGIRRLADLGLELDVNGPARIHSAVARLAADVPTLRIVVNHVGGAGEPSRLTDAWRQGMAAMARQPNVYCKVSALLEQTEQASRQPGTAPRDVAYYRPVLDHCWNTFGADRLIYGSNWPVCEKGGSYADQFAIVREFFREKGPEATEKYFWRNAAAAYRWNERSRADG
ncbi:MAG: amidohydrolase [Pirellulaceae bacterium]